MVNTETFISLANITQNSYIYKADELQYILE